VPQSATNQTPFFAHLRQRVNFERLSHSSKKAEVFRLGFLLAKLKFEHNAKKFTTFVIALLKNPIQNTCHG
jgi:hypothetical protein